MKGCLKFDGLTASRLTAHSAHAGYIDTWMACSYDKYLGLYTSILLHYLQNRCPMQSYVSSAVAVYLSNIRIQVIKQQQRMYENS